MADGIQPELDVGRKLMMQSSQDTSVDLETVTAIAALSLRLGQTLRATRHPDGERESDTTHTVMLALTAAWLVSNVPSFRSLRLDRVLLYALVHDLPEALTGDYDTLRGLLPEARKARRAAEARAVEAIRDEVPWLATAIQDYEAGSDEEAGFVRYLDKILPKLTHNLNGGDGLRLQGLSSLIELEVLHGEQAAALSAQYPSFPDLHELFRRAAIAARVSFVQERPFTLSDFGPLRADRARLQEDPDVIFADFLCWARPTEHETACSTIWSVQIPRSDATEAGIARYKCPKCSASATLSSLAGTLPVDGAGYPIDRRHPLYEVPAGLRAVSSHFSKPETRDVGDQHDH